jgi:hypothetical protein
MSSIKYSSLILILVLILTPQFAESKNEIETKGTAISEIQINKGNTRSAEPKKKTTTTKHKSSRRTHIHRALLMGDIGQYEIYLRNKKTKLFKPDEYVASVREVCGDFNEKHKNDMTVNFDPVLKKIKTLKNINEAVILGDMVYPEIKAAGIGSRYNGLKRVTKLYEYEENLTEYIYRLHCGWLHLVKVFKDASNPHWLKDNLRMIFGNHTYDVNYKTEAFYISNYFQLKEATLAKSKGGVKVVNNLNEHDVLFPKLVYADGPNQIIQYLDMDPTLLTCSHFLYTELKGEFRQFNSPKEFRAHANYKEWIKCLQYERLMTNPGLEVLTSRRVNIYMRYLRHMLILLSNFDRGADWRIVRMHQPVFNPDNDYVGLKHNKLLMQAFKKAHIHLWFVAHNHTGQIDLSLYEDKDYKYLNPRVFPGSGVRKGEPGDGEKTENVCVGAQDPYYDEKWNQIRKVSPTCVNRSRVWLRYSRRHKKHTKKVAPKHPSKTKKTKDPTKKTKPEKFSKFGKMYINRENEELIIQTLVGYSGRSPDPLFSDKFSDMVMLWGFTESKRPGYAIAEFYDDHLGRRVCETKYYAKEVKTDKFVTVFTFKVVQSERAKPLSKKQILKKNFKVDIEKLLRNKFDQKKYNEYLLSLMNKKPAAAPIK